MYSFIKNGRIMIMYTGNESTRLARTIRIIDKHIKIAYKTKKLDNIISKNIEQINKNDRKGAHKLACTSCNTFYIGRTSRNLNTRFIEHTCKRQVQIL